jgi:trypsin
MYEPRIIGGNEAQRGRYPYMVSLTYQYSHVCGGSLIADDMVLSAAHCSGFFDGIEIGRHDLSDDGEQFERYNIESFTNHPGFNGDSSSVGAFDNDYMLVKMYGFSRNNKIQLNSDPSVPSLSDDELYVMGWGVDNVVSKSTSDVLKGKLKTKFSSAITHLHQCF